MPVARVLFTPPAHADVISSQTWYENQAPGLGARFLSELEAVVGRLESNALQFQVVFRDVRVRRFPYGLFFRTEDDTVLVIACFHTSRDPDVWQRRG